MLVGSPDDLMRNPVLASAIILGWLNLAPEGDLLKQEDSCTCGRLPACFRNVENTKYRRLSLSSVSWKETGIATGGRNSDDRTSVLVCIHNEYSIQNVP